MGDFPETGEMVVCRVKKVLNYGVFVEFLEYEDVPQGFVHISQVASSWVKNIRNFVKENQIRVGQVTRIDTSKNQIDVSFTKISPHREKEKIDEWKLFKRQQNLVDLIAKQKGSDFDKAWDDVAEPLLSRYDNLIQAFERILLEGETAAAGVGKEWMPALVSVVKKNIQPPKKTVSGNLTVSTAEPDGIEAIKNALLEARNAPRDAELEINYAGSGRHHIKATASDYKTAEREITAASARAVEYMKKHKGSASFERL
jgi:translation initiation factor 2 subunit 1